MTEPIPEIEAAIQIRDERRAAHDLAVEACRLADAQLLEVMARHGCKRYPCGERRWIVVDAMQRVRTVVGREPQVRVVEPRPEAPRMPPTPVAGDPFATRRRAGQ